jgi:hypothetical protein
MVRPLLLWLLAISLVACSSADDENHNDVNQTTEPHVLVVTVDTFDDLLVVDPATDSLTFAFDCNHDDCELECAFTIPNNPDPFVSRCPLSGVFNTSIGHLEGVYSLTVTGTLTDGDEVLTDQATGTASVLYAFAAGLEGIDEGDIDFSHPPELSPFCTLDDCELTCTWVNGDGDVIGETDCADLAFPDTEPSLVLTLQACRTVDDEGTELSHCNDEQVYSFTYTDPSWLEVSAGGAHTCAILNDHTLWCWGDNTSGRLGIDGAGGATDVPRRVAGLWQTVSAGGQHTCGITVAGELYCWGFGSSGQVDPSSNTADNPAPVLVNDERPWLKVAAGGTHSCAIDSQQALYCWGDNSYQQLGAPDPDDDFHQVTANSGAISAWSDITAGGNHTCAVTDDDNANAWCWGLHSSGQLNGETSPDDTEFPIRPIGDPGSNTFNTLFVHAGGVHSCALMDSGDSYCWGSNTYSQLGHENGPAVGQVLAIGQVTQLSTGEHHTCAISAEDARCWGRDDNGRLGKGTTGDSVDVEGEPWTWISAGGEHTCGVFDEAVYCWGNGAEGRLGKGEDTTSAPGPIAWPHAR